VGTSFYQAANLEGTMPAPLWRRLAAACYDSLLLLAVFMLATVGIIAVHGAAIAAESLWYQGLLAAIAWLYLTWFWVHGGQTVGMRAWRIRIAGSSPHDVHSAVGWRRATVRFLAVWAPAAPLIAVPWGVDLKIGAVIASCAFVLGFTLSLFVPSKQCWHDHWSRTRLLRIESIANAATATPEPR
jgi:uncharacterized RDD family membrane protein YckC